MPSNVERHLILVNRPRWQAIEDFEDIKKRIEARAPDIEVFIATTEGPNISLRKRAAKRPTLVMCPSDLRQFEPRRGKVYHGRIVPKKEQIDRLVALGIPAPTHIEPHVERVTLNPAVLSVARSILVVATGEAKAAVVRDALQGEGDPRQLPARLARTGTATWILDDAAGSDLEQALRDRAP